MNLVPEEDEKGLELKEKLYSILKEHTVILVVLLKVSDVRHVCTAF